MAAVELAGLSKHYGGDGRPALDALDLSVADGELLVLVGPSGCGKSTALRLIAGLEEPTAGTIELEGTSLRGVPPQMRDVAMVFQGYALYPHLSVFDNMAFPLKMQGQGESQRRAKVAKIAEMVGLSDKLERRPHELSGGERQRVAMGRAVVREPRLFLFDEPLSNLDAKLRADLRVELAALVRKLSTTALYVTHDQAEAMTMGDRVAVLKDGRLQQVAPPRVIYEKPANAFVASFVGTPEMNLWTLEVHGDEGRVEGAVVPVPESVRDRARVTIGVRPEHLWLDADGEGRIEAKALGLEPLGPETLVYLETTGGERLRARVPGFGGPEVGAEVTLSVGSAHWFDDDGVRIAP